MLLMFAWVRTLAVIFSRARVIPWRRVSASLWRRQQLLLLVFPARVPDRTTRCASAASMRKPRGLAQLRVGISSFRCWRH
jgi:hypothetical protein